MLNEDNSGFINFPLSSNLSFTKLDVGKTFVYIVAFDAMDLTNKAYELSNLHLIMPGTFVGDDITNRPRVKDKMSIEDLIEDQIKNDEYDKVYFPNFTGKSELKRIMSIPMTSCICVGWSEFTFESKDKIGLWSASFRDLTHEGRRLYYSIKKLHNNKEVRILTFSNI